MRIVIAAALVVLPLAPLLLTWQRVREGHGIESVNSLGVGALIVTASFVLLLAGLMWAPLWGADYSLRRFAIIYVNLAVVIVVGLVAFVGSRDGVTLGIASCIVALEWLYLAAVSSVG